MYVYAMYVETISVLGVEEISMCLNTGTSLTKIRNFREAKSDVDRLWCVSQVIEDMLLLGRRELFHKAALCSNIRFLKEKKNIS